MSLQKGNPNQYQPDLNLNSNQVAELQTQKAMGSIAKVVLIVSAIPWVLFFLAGIWGSISRLAFGELFSLSAVAFVVLCVVAWLFTAGAIWLVCQKCEPFLKLFIMLKNKIFG